MDTIIDEFVTTKKTGKETNEIIETIEEETERLELCEKSIASIKQNGRSWSSDDVVIDQLRKEKQTLQNLIKLLKAQMKIQQQYKPMNLSFLKRRQKTDLFPGITLPLFSVHNINGTYVEDMLISLYRNRRCEDQLNVEFANSRRNHGTSKTIHDSLTNNLRDAIGISQKGQWKKGRMGEFTYEMKQGWRSGPTLPDMSENVKSSFIGVIPDKTKKEIKHAQDIIENDVYLVREAIWEKVPITTDPLIICIAPNDEAYFITSFDCTPVEYWAKQEYTE